MGVLERDGWALCGAVGLCCWEGRVRLRVRGKRGRGGGCLVGGV